jgi:hypothetical protein
LSEYSAGTEAKLATRAPGSGQRRKNWDTKLAVLDQNALYRLSNRENYIMSIPIVLQYSTTNKYDQLVTLCNLLLTIVTLELRYP